MTIIEKLPHSESKLIYVNSKILSNLSEELSMSFTAIPIGRSYVVLKQTFTNQDSDEYNFRIKEENIEIIGKCFIVKAGKEKILEITKEDQKDIVKYLEE